MPKLKFIVKDLDAVDEIHKELYEEVDGEFRLNVDSVPVDKDAVKKQKDKVEEFRNNNTKLLKENEKLIKKLESYSGLDVNEAKELLKTKKQVEEKALIDKGEIEQLVNNRLKPCGMNWNLRLKN